MRIVQNEATAAERRIPFLAVRASANSLQLVDLGDIATAEVATPAAPTVAPQGTAGTTAYSYKVVARNANGETLPSTAGSTATGNATLGVTNFNRVTWAAVTGAASYDVYRSASAGTPATTGKIVSATTALTADDTGLAASGAEPGTNTTADRFTLTVTTTTAEVKYAADMATAIEAALEALAEVAAGDVQAFKLSTGQVYAVGFSGTLTGTSIPLMVISEATTFTPGDVTGGVLDSAVTGLGGDWPAADIRITKAGVAAAQGAGTVEEDEDGVYDYIATAGEVDTLGRLVGKVRTFGVSVYPLSAQIVEAASGQRILHSGTLQAATSNTATLANTASGTSDYYAGMLLTITGGTGALQKAMIISSYNGTSKVATLAETWPETPSTDSEYEVTPIGTMRTTAIAAEVLATVTSDGIPFDGANIDAPVSSRATPAQVATELATYDGPTNTEMEARTRPTAEYATAATQATIAGYIDTEVGALAAEVAAVKVKTDNLPADTATTLAALATAADLAVIDGIVDDVLARIGVPSVTLAADIAAGGAVDGDAIADALLDRTDGVETSVTPRHALRLMLAVLAGKATVSGATVTFRNVGDTKDRVVSTTTAVGARTTVTTDVS